MHFPLRNKKEPRSRRDDWRTSPTQRTRTGTTTENCTLRHKYKKVSFPATGHVLVILRTLAPRRGGPQSHMEPHAELMTRHPRLVRQERARLDPFHGSSSQRSSQISQHAAVQNELQTSISSRELAHCCFASPSSSSHWSRPGIRCQSRI